MYNKALGLALLWRLHTPRQHGAYFHSEQMLEVLHIHPPSQKHRQNRSIKLNDVTPRPSKTWVCNVMHVSMYVCISFQTYTYINAPTGSPSTPLFT
jgi:hypothetical protein